MMIHSELGNHACDCWFAIPQHFPFVRLGVFVVMPNHVHGIVTIDKNGDGCAVETQNIASPNNKTQNFASLQLPPSQSNTKSNKFGPQSQNLASVVRGYKIGVTNMARNGTDAKYCVSTIWQSRYHDHIIRNADEYKRIENYIINNPVRWKDDKFYRKP